VVHGFIIFVTHHPFVIPASFGLALDSRKCLLRKMVLIYLHVLAGGIAHADYKSLNSQWHKKIGSDAIGRLKSAEKLPWWPLRQARRRCLLLLFFVGIQLEDGLSINC
jgi:hypothetical protein